MVFCSVIINHANHLLQTDLGDKSQASRPGGTCEIISTSTFIGLFTFGRRTTDDCDMTQNDI